MGTTERFILEILRILHLKNSRIELHSTELSNQIKIPFPENIGILTYSIFNLMADITSNLH